LRFNKNICVVLFIVAFSLAGYAEDRTYVLGTSLNLTGGGTNRLSGAGIGGQPDVTGVGPTTNQPLFLFYGAFPTINLTSKGRRSLFDASYSYGTNWSKATQKFGSQTHSGSLRYSVPLSKELQISFSDSVLSTSSSASFNASRGVLTDATQPFVFFPEAFQITARSNAAIFAAIYQASDRSSLTVNLSNLLLNYEGVNGTAVTALSNQNRYSGDIGYSYQSGKDETWTAGFTAAYMNFKTFGNAYVQSPHIGYSNQIAPGLTMNFTVGLSQVKSQATGASYTGYDSSAGLRKSIGSNDALSANFTQTSADTSGLGSVSNTWRTGVSYSHPQGSATMMVDTSFFETKGTLDNTFGARGIDVMANAGVPLSSRWAFQITGQYQRYYNASVFGFTDRRFFLSLHYNNPTLWKGSR
jgi:hypothetical protein